jgi:signal transduction histidine kinase/ActR/RegA family two-component response regulator
VTELAVSVFELDRGRAALEKYAVVNHQTVQVYGVDGRPVAGPVNRTMLFDLFSRGRGPGMFARCARECLGQSDPGAPVVIEEEYGLAVIGTPLVLAGGIVGAAVAGYALTTHLTYREAVRLARDYGLPFDEVWAVTRKELPESPGRLPLRGELLGILGNTLVSEHHRSRQLEETSQRLAEAAEAKDRFLAVLSHELRTPLTAILGYAVLVRRGKLGAAATANAFEVIERNARLQTVLIDDLLDISRIISGSLRLNLAPTGLGPVIGTAVTNVRPRAHAKGIRLGLVLDPQAPVISGDPVRLQQIVSNLLINAVKFTPSGGTVEVRLEGQGSHVHIVVHDTGAGIHREFLPYVFDRFRQEDTTETRRHDGLGLGLAIVRDLVKLHNGSISAESAGVGQGATFTVSLPVLDKAEASSVLKPRPSSLGSLESLDEVPTLEGLRVLVVDDDRDARDLFTRALEQYNARVTTVASAAAALEALARWKPNVLVSDIAMPGESGYVLMQKIRRLTPEQGGAIPALALTAYAGLDDAQLALSAGFQAHVAKPIQPATLALAVGELARGIRCGER